MRWLKSDLLGRTGGRLLLAGRRAPNRKRLSSFAYLLAEGEGLLSVVFPSTVLRSMVIPFLLLLWLGMLRLVLTSNGSWL